jgi:hypothetical protein
MLNFLGSRGVGGVFSASLLALLASTGCSSSPAPATTSDAGPTETGGTTHPLPTGFGAAQTDAVNGEYFGYDLSLAADANGEPMLAYGWLSPSDKSKTALYFTRWDRTTGAFTAPVVIDATVDSNIGTSQPLRETALARDASTGRLGVVYVVNDVATNPSNPPHRVFIKTSTDNGATWSSRTQLSQDGGDDHAQAGGPSIAMSGGKVYVAFVQDGQTVCDDSATDCGGGAGVWFLEGDGTNFASRTALSNAYGIQSSMLGLTSMALDGAGLPGLAWLSSPRTAYNRKALYWHHGDATVTKVFDSSNTQNDDPSVALGFAGSKPGVFATLSTGSSDTGVHFASAADGKTWGAPVAVPLNGQRDASYWTALTFDAKGAGYALTYTNGGPGGVDYCGSGAQLFTSTDLTTWKGCGIDATKAYPNINGRFVQAYVGPDGKLVAAGLGSLGSADADGIWVYRAP